MLNHQVVHLKYVQILFVNYTSILMEINKKKKEKIKGRKIHLSNLFINIDVKY